MVRQSTGKRAYQTRPKSVANSTGTPWKLQWTRLANGAVRGCISAIKTRLANPLRKLIRLYF